MVGQIALNHVEPAQVDEMSSVAGIGFPSRRYYSPNAQTEARRLIIPSTPAPFRTNCVPPLVQQTGGHCG